MIRTNKELGQNFLFDQAILEQIADCGGLNDGDTVLEIGPGLGMLTSYLLKRAGHVVAVEFDAKLAANLRSSINQLQVENGQPKLSLDNLTIVNDDFLQFDLSALPMDYKVVANIPYNITSKIIEKLWTADNKPALAVLLVQKEVAERLAAAPGDLSVLAIAAQTFAELRLGVKVPAELFVPAPKVDSQVVIMKRRHKVLVPADKLDQFFYVVKAGFSEKRKKLRSSLAVGLKTNKVEAERLLAEAGIDPNKRAQELTIDEWKRLAKV